MSLRTILVNTDSDGAFTYERELAATVRAIAIELDTLESPDIVITDGVYGTALLSVSGLGDDQVFQPGVLFSGEENDTLTATAVMGTLKVEVTNGGATKHGRITVLVDR